MTVATWETVLEDFHTALPPSGPLVFLIGAGCSLSSGGPTTLSAFRDLDSSVRRFPQKQRNFVSDQSASEKQVILASAFQDFSPGIGYHLLASLALSRPIYVINFNWDDGIERAAHDQGIKFQSFEPDTAIWEALRLDEGAVGLSIVHVHGSLLGNPLARLTETYKFPKALGSILDNLWCYPKLCIGVDLAYELDFFDYVESHRGKSTYRVLGTSPEDNPQRMGTSKNCNA